MPWMGFLLCLIGLLVVVCLNALLYISWAHLSSSFLTAEPSGLLFGACGAHVTLQQLLDELAGVARAEHAGFPCAWDPPSESVCLLPRQGHCRHPGPYGICSHLEDTPKPTGSWCEHIPGGGDVHQGQQHGDWLLLGAVSSAPHLGVASWVGKSCPWHSVWQMPPSLFVAASQQAQIQLQCAGLVVVFRRKTMMKANNGTEKSFSLKKVPVFSFCGQAKAGLVFWA